MWKTILPRVWGSSKPKQVHHSNSVNVDPWKISEGTLYTDACPSEESKVCFVCERRGGLCRLSLGAMPATGWVCICVFVGTLHGLPPRWWSSLWIQCWDCCFSTVLVTKKHHGNSSSQPFTHGLLAQGFYSLTVEGCAAVYVNWELQQPQLTYSHSSAWEKPQKCLCLSF